MKNSQLVVFTLGNEDYAININYAQEIIRIPTITRMPNTPSFLEGIFNLRGKAIPVLNLKKRFSLCNLEQGSDSRLLILDLDGIKTGIIVDDVSEVMSINEQSIQNLDNEIVGISKNSIDGVCLIEERIIILLNVVNLKKEVFRLDFKSNMEVMQ